MKNRYIISLLLTGGILLSNLASAQTNEPTGLDIGLSRPALSTNYGLNIHKVIGASPSYTNIQLIEKDWSGSHAILFNSYAGSSQVAGGLSSFGNTKYANGPGSYTSGAGAIMFFGNSGLLNFYITPPSTGQDENITWGTPKMHINRSGQVGIGTTTVPDGYTLAVDGKVIMEEAKVSLSSSWSDFVFESDYILPTLQEVENYIDQNGHLPDIPSAAEVEENGISLGEMDAKLLQKIEELTLYAVAQQKEIQKLKERKSILEN
jgi:hypothetical protein